MSAVRSAGVPRPGCRRGSCPPASLSTASRTAESATAPARLPASRCGTCEESATTESCPAGDIGTTRRVRRRRRSARPASGTAPTPSAPGRAPRPRSTKQPGRAAVNPARSVPAIGWPGTNRSVSPCAPGERGDLRLGAAHVGERHTASPVSRRHARAASAGRRGQRPAEEDHVPVADRVDQVVGEGQPPGGPSAPGGRVRVPADHVDAGLVQPEQDRTADQAGADHRGPHRRTWSSTALDRPDALGEPLRDRRDVLVGLGQRDPDVLLGRRAVEDAGGDQDAALGPASRRSPSSPRPGSARGRGPPRSARR